MFILVYIDSCLIKVSHINNMYRLRPKQECSSSSFSNRVEGIQNSPNNCIYRGCDFPSLISIKRLLKVDVKATVYHLKYTEEFHF